MGGRGEEGVQSVVYTLSNNWKWQLAVNQNSDSKLHAEASSRIRRRAFLGKPRSIHSYSWRLVESKLVDQVLVGEIKKNLDWSLKVFSQDGHGVMNFLSWFFLNGRVVPSRGSHPRSSNYCVCDGRCAHTHLLHAQFSGAHFVHAHFSCVWTHMHGSSCLQFACPLFWLTIFLSCFTRLCSCCSLTVTSRPLPATTLLTPTTSCRTFPSWKHRSSALRQRTSCLATLPSSFLSQVMSPRSSTRSLPWTMTRWPSTIRTTISPTSRKPRTRTQDNSVFSTVFESSVLHVSHSWFCSSERKQRKHAIGKPLQDREREEREGSVISVEESTSMKSRRNSIRSHSLQTHRKSFSEESQRILFWWMRSSRTPGRAQQAVLGENSVQRQWHSTEYDMEIQNLERRNSEYALFESQWELDSKTTILGRCLLDSSSSTREREYILCSELKMMNCLQEVAKNLKN